MRRLYCWLGTLAFLCAGIMSGCRTAVGTFGAGEYMVVDVSAGPSAPSYPVLYRRSVPAGGWTDEYKTTKIVLRRVPAGSFRMGRDGIDTSYELLLSQGSFLVTSPSADMEGHQVTLPHDYYIGVFEITQRQWERVMGTWPSYYQNKKWRDTRPVEQVSYNGIRGSTIGARWPADSGVDGDSFMGRLRARTGAAFDLPTEAQWEYAARAGMSTDLNTGLNLLKSDEDACMAKAGRYLYNSGYEREAGVYEFGRDASVATAKVGSYLPNARGLYDFHGNVREWCLDWYNETPATASNPKGPPSSGGPFDARVQRGGGWDCQAYLCSVTARGSSGPDDLSSGVGFRVALPSGQ